jgi:hypothetical protein
MLLGLSNMGLHKPPFLFLRSLELWTERTDRSTQMMDLSSWADLGNQCTSNLYGFSNSVSAPERMITLFLKAKSFAYLAWCKRNQQWQTKSPSLFKPWTRFHNCCYFQSWWFEVWGSEVNSSWNLWNVKRFQVKLQHVTWNMVNLWNMKSFGSRTRVDPRGLPSHLHPLLGYQISLRAITFRFVRLFHSA